MTFTTRFPVRPTKSPLGFSFTGLTVCDGDSITCEVAGFEIIARIVRDDCPDAPEFRGSENAPGERFPEGRQDGFWPSLYKDAPGFIGEADQELVRGTNSPPERPNHRQRFAKAQAEAEAIMEAWRKDDWFYCGIVLSVALAGVTLDGEAGDEKVQWTFSLPNAASLWGVEANYPDSDNSYLTEVAQELLPEALDTARAAARRLCATLETSGARAP